MYNPLTVSLFSAQLLNAERKAREAADTIFKVFGMTQLKIKSSLLALQANAPTTRPSSQSA